MFTRTRRLVSFSSSVRSSSTFWPPRPMTMPGLAVWIVTMTWFALRSSSTRETAASDSRLRISLRMLRSSCSSSV